MSNVSGISFGAHYRDSEILVPKHCGETIRFSFPNSSCTQCGEFFDTTEVTDAMAEANGRGRKDSESSRNAAILMAALLGRFQ